MTPTKQSVLIIGSGFIGSHLLKSLLDSEVYNVKALVHKSAPKWISRSKGILVFRGDVCDRASLDKAIGKGDIVINLTGQVSESMADFFAVNFCGVSNLASVCRSKRVKKIVHISSILIYGDLEGSGKRSFREDDPPNPSNDYSETKYFTEKIMKSFAEETGIGVVVLRLANVYGPSGKGIINRILRLAREKKSMEVNNGGRQTRDFIYVDDVTSAINIAMRHTPAGNFDIINISNNKGIQLNEILEYIEEKGLDLDIRYKKSALREDLRNIADNSKAARLLRFSPKIGFYKGMDMLLKKEGGG